MYRCRHCGEWQRSELSLGWCEDCWDFGVYLGLRKGQARCAAVATQEDKRESTHGNFTSVHPGPGR
jgi:hypothetical protein